MSFLTIDKKAVTLEEEKALLAQSIALLDSFGTSTFVISPEDLKEYRNSKWGDKALNRFSRLFASQKNWPQLSEFAKKHGIEGEELSVFNKKVQEVFKRKFSSGSDYNFTASCLRKSDETSKYAHNYEPDEYESPSYAVMAFAEGEIAAQAILKAMSFGEIPGSNEQWNFSDIWHSRAQLSGAGFEQADAIFSAINRKAFENCDVIKAVADYRVYKVIACEMFNDGVLAVNKWPSVEALDHIAGLHESIIDKMDEEYINNIRFQKFDPLQETVEEARELILRGTNGEWTPEVLAMASLHAGGDPALGGNMRQIIDRCNLAFTRISIGEAAYIHPEDFVLEKVLKSESEEPLTFNPGENMPSVG